MVMLPDSKNRPLATVVRKRLLTDDLMILWLAIPFPFTFKPGQYCTIGIGDLERPYSIASAPGEKYIELFVELLPEKVRTDQSLTPHLFALEKGDTVALRPRAKGVFLLEEKSTTHVMIATVTGIAPFISMVRASFSGYYKKTFTKPFYIFQGASYFDEFGYFEELTEAAKRGQIIYVPTVSRPQEDRNRGWSGQAGRVNLIIHEYFKKFDITPQDTMIYLCGNKGMTEDLGNKKPTAEKPLGKLVRAGFNVKEEIFW